MAATAPSTTSNYVVVLSDDVTDPATLAAQQVKSVGGTLGFVYQYAFKGYSGRDCVSPSTPSLDDPNGHGTHVAGTIGARDDSQGVVGVAPGARLWSVRVADAGGFATFAQAICGVDFVTANAATIEVANMSLEGSGTDPGGAD